MEENIDVNDRTLGIIKKMHVLRHNLFFQHLIDSEQFLYIKTGVAVGAKQRHDQGLNSRMRSPICIRGHTGIDDIATSFDGLEMAHRCHTRSKMAMQMNRGFGDFLKCFDQIIRIVRGD